MFLLHFRNPFWVDFGFSTFFFLGRAFPASLSLPVASPWISSGGHGFSYLPSARLVGLAEGPVGLETSSHLKHFFKPPVGCRPPDPPL